MKAGKLTSLRETIDFWQPYYPQALTNEDAREIADNTTGFFNVLAEWERESKEDSLIDEQGQRERAEECTRREEVSKQREETPGLNTHPPHSGAATAKEAEPLWQRNCIKRKEAANKDQTREETCKRQT